MKTLDQDVLERRIQQIGRELFDRMKEEREPIFRSDTWTSRLMNWSTRHENARLQLFRFVDVLPSLKSDRDVVGHLREYFQGRPDPFSGLLKVGLGLAQVGGIAEKAMATALRKGLEQVARTFIAADSHETAVSAVADFRRERLAFSLDVLGEATLSDREADEYQVRYLELLQALTKEAKSWQEIPQIDRAPWGPLPKVNLSVKLTALNPHFDPINPLKSIANSLKRLEPIAQAAAKEGGHLHIDTEDYHVKELTFDAFKTLGDSSYFKNYRHLGIVLQGYLKESEDDAKRLIQWAERRGTPITVRLVKGAYWDYETVYARLQGWSIPVFTDKNQTDAHFERLTRLLLGRDDVIDLAIGSHNVRSIATALAIAEELDLPKGSVEFQFLYGMALPLRKALVERGERVRVYTPYGELIPGMAYLVRRLLENTSNESFVRKGFAEDQPIEDLLADPAKKMSNNYKPVDRTEKSAAPHRAGMDRNGVDQTIGHQRNGSEKPIDSTAHTQALGVEPFANHPTLDFAQGSNREKFAHALDDAVRNRLGRDYPLLIGVEEIRTGNWITSVNPSLPHQVIGRAAAAGIEEANRAVDAAEAALERWSSLLPSKRAEILEQAADRMNAFRFELAALMSLEAGKPWREADADVAEAIDFLRYYARNALTLLKPISLSDLDGENNVLIREPRGVTAVIAPWNFPLAILTGMTSAALATGNTVVVKPAEPTPVIAYHMVRILRSAGVPEGALNYLPGSGEVAGQALVDHPKVHIVAFTGSRQVGLHILKRASQVKEGERHIKRVIAEMGGKNAIIIDSDADLDEAVMGVAQSAFGFAGQKCSACSRAIIVEPAYDAFVRRLVEAAKSLPFGPATDPETVIGPVTTEEAWNRIRGYIEKGRLEGVPLLVQEAPPQLKASGGYFIPPTIFGDVSNDATIACEEIFGPVLSCMRAKSFDEALDIAMDSNYALTGGVFTRSPGHARKAAQRFRVGNLYINRKTTGALVGRQPFGGMRLSGIGFKAGGPDYLLQFVEARTVTENTLRRGFASELNKA